MFGSNLKIRVGLLGALLSMALLALMPGLAAASEDNVLNISSVRFN